MTKTRIQPSKPFSLPDFKELWDYRELLAVLTMRDIKVRYKQTMLGLLWAIIQPVLMMVVFTLIFSNVAKLSSDGLPYPIFTFCALLPWQLFSRSLTDASMSLTINKELVTKVYCPRLIILSASIGSAFVDFLIASAILGGMIVYYGIVPSANAYMVPIFIALGLLASLSVSLWFSVLNAMYRDIRYVLPFLTQAWMWASPIAYSSSEISEKWRLVYALNPMVSVVDGMRWSLLGTDTQPDMMMMVVSIGALFALLLGGLLFFQRMQTTMVDVI